MRERNLNAEIRAALSDPSVQEAVPKATRMSATLRKRALAGFEGYEEARRAARRIKEDAIERLPDLVETLEASVRAGGGVVHRAPDAGAARAIITGIAREEGCRRAVKSKSMTSEEIELNGALEADGVAVRETDLGEYIVQLDGDRPSHIIAPILHKSLADVRRAFREGLDLPDDQVPETPEGLTQLARRLLRDDFLQADLGITGANFLLAESGTVVLVENEGNGRLSTQLPRVHVALAGIEKILPGIAELEPFLELLPRSATGQLATGYLSFLSGPGWGGSPFSAGPRRFHLVLLDNGRSAMRDDPVLREALYCIRCGACLNVCPPYQAVGGHVYGGPTYQSGIGNAWEAGVRDLATAAEFNELCTTCARCRDVCPVKIDIPWMNVGIRERIREQDGSLVASLLEEPVRLYRLARGAGPLRGLVETPPVRALLERRLGLDRRRRLPSLPPRTLSAWHASRGGVVHELDGRRAASPGSRKLPADDREPAPEPVLLWADCHTEHVDVEVGRATIRVLERAGFQVELATGPCCGRAALSQGNLPEARRQARVLTEWLGRVPSPGDAVVAVEPSCATCVTEEYPRLLAEESTDLTARVQEVMEFLGQRRDRLPTDETESAADRTVIVHGHCQQKSAGRLERSCRPLADVPGWRVVHTGAECCGMAGSFGYKTGGYDISMELGARLEGEVDALVQEAESPERESRVEVVAFGTSCRAQLRDLGRQKVRHPIQLLDERLEETGPRDG